MHRAVATSNDVFTSDLGKLVAQVPEAQQRTILIAARGLSRALPFAQFVEASVCFNSSYREFSYQVALLPQGYIGVQFLYINASFQLQWANPAWALLEMDPATELEGVKNRIAAALRQWPEALWTEKAFLGHETSHLLTLEPSPWLQMRYLFQAWWQELIIN